MLMFAGGVSNSAAKEMEDSLCCMSLAVTVMACYEKKVKRGMYHKPLAGILYPAVQVCCLRMQRVLNADVLKPTMFPASSPSHC
jgi:hypothetical protein